MKSVGTKEIKTKRLVLRPFRMDDAMQAYKNYGSDEKVNQYISFAPCFSLESTQKFIQMHLDQYESNPDFYGWAITLDDEVIGSIGLFNVEGHQCELGYSLGSKWWGLGYATEAALAVKGYAFDEIKAHRMYASHHIDNLASGNVLQKIGMVYEGTLRDGQENPDGSYSDLKLYSVLSSDVI
ncbi:acetyltransferase, GNAT family [Lachnospiraceae bacterium TWA4]|nr:acetyltransferase, GNAT family [Lachnospiraceae bacterium TWA4]